MRLLFSSILSILTTHSFFNYASGQICSYNTTEGLRISVGDTQSTMLSMFDSTCKSSNDCVITEGVVETVQTRRYTDFDRLATPIDFYEQYVDACTDMGMTICLVTHKMRITTPANNALGIPAGTLLLEERDKPYCYPSSCKEDQFSDLNTVDKQCQLAQLQGGCDVFESTATCPEDRVVSGDNSRCGRDEPGLFSSVQLNKNALFGLMDAQCADASSELGPNSDRFCDVETLPAELLTANTYTSFLDTSDTFTDFHRDCDSNGGTACAVSFDLQYAPLGDTVSVMDIAFDYTDYPICVPKPCAGDTSLAEEHILSDFAGTEVGLSLCQPGTCTYNVTNIRCFPDFVEPVVEVEEPVAEETEEDEEEEVEEGESEGEGEDDMVGEEGKDSEEEPASSAGAHMPITYLVAAVSIMGFLF